MIITYLKHSEIDKSKWDNCVENSENGLIYGMSWYLDVVCENWDALISDNYEAVMPLPWKSKLGIKYIYHPFFAQQLGLFYQNSNANNIDEFIKHIPSQFLKYDLFANHLNKTLNAKNSRINSILELDDNYAEIFNRFSENTKRNIRKGEKNIALISESISIEAFLLLLQNNVVSNLNHNHYEILKSLFTMLIHNNHAKIIGIKDSQEVLLGAVLFVTFKNRIIYNSSASTERGKNQRVMFTLINEIIRENASQNKILDFEGSMIEGVARFFKGFGANTETYLRIQNSRIPFIK